MELQALALKLFGPFEASYHDQPLPTLATDKIRALLAYLAIESGRPHRREALAALLWPDYPNEIALRNLRQSLYRLRQTLQETDPVLPDRLITQTRPTITLNPDALTLDTCQFTQLLEQVKTASDPCPLLTQTTRLYRGELLQGLTIPDAYAFDEWLSIQREVFHQQATHAFTQLITLNEAQDNPDSVLSTATQLLALEPWHEETHRQIMRAHIKKGNRSQAIAQYQELKTILLRDLGVEPSPATTALFHQIQAESIPPSAATPSQSRSQLYHFPTPLTPIIGRKHELDELAQTLQEPTCRLLTITGPGGMGKTRLCIETARRLSSQSNRFPDGLYFIPLAQIEHGELLTTTIIQNLGLPLPQTANPRQELLNHLQTKQTLLVLDNFEHLLQSSGGDLLFPAISTLVEILSHAPQTTFLTTSREPLNIQGEWIYTLEGLSYGHQSNEADNDPLTLPAPQLFIQNARRYRPSFDPPANIDAILTLCRLTDGMPLALEMAAAWMRAYDCQEIVERISQSLDFLTNPFRDAPARQQSIRAIFTSSWEQLPPETRQVLAAMSVFRGGFTVKAALSVAQASVLDLATLVEKAFVRRLGEGRYEQHELVRQFAAEKLAETGDEESVRERHADFYLTLLEEQGPGLFGMSPQEAIANIRRELDNVRQAWVWLMTGNNHARAVQVATPLEDFYRLSGLIREAEQVFHQAVDWAERTSATQVELAALLIHLANVLSFVGENELALPFVERAKKIAERENLAFELGMAYFILGVVDDTKGDYTQSTASRQQAAEIFERIGEKRYQAYALNGIAKDHWQKSEYAASAAVYAQSLGIFTALKDRFGAAQTAGALGLVHLRQGEYPQALACFQQELDTAREMDNPLNIARALNNMAVVHHDQGKIDEALVLLEEAAAIDRRLGVKLGLAKRLTNMGLMYWKFGAYDQALKTEQEALRLLEDLNHQEGIALNLGNIGLVYWHQGDYAAALVAIRKALEIDEARGNKDGIARHLSNIGGIYKDEEDFDQALDYLEQAFAIQSEANLRYPLSETLLRLTEVHLVRGDFAQAETCRQQGMDAAQTINRQDSIFWARELEARLSVARGDLATAQEQFNTLLTDAKEDEQFARVYFHLWQATGDEAIREVARGRYEGLLAKVPKAEFRKRLEKLIDPKPQR